MGSPVIAHHQQVYVGNESAFGTPPLPTAAMAMEVVTCDMGPAEQRDTRPKKDKTASRDMTTGFVAGRVQPIPFSLEASVRSRADADDLPIISAILKAAGLSETVNAAANVTYAIASAPTETGLSILSVLGPEDSRFQAEHGRGGVVRSLSFSGGDSELMVRAQGAFAGKRHLGQTTGTLIDGADTSLALDTTAHSYRLGLGYYKIEDEVIQVTAIDHGTGAVTVTRAQAGTVAAAHASAVLEPYAPAFAPTGDPISEADFTVSIDGSTERCTKFALEITTGIDHLGGESGSAYVQGTKAVRADAKLSIDLVLTKELVALIGKASERKEMALIITCGTGAGGIVTFNLPYCELEPMPTPAPANDVSVVTLSFRCRGDSGNDLFTVVFS